MYEPCQKESSDIVEKLNRKEWRGEAVQFPGLKPETSTNKDGSGVCGFA